MTSVVVAWELPWGFLYGCGLVEMEPLVLLGRLTPSPSIVVCFILVDSTLKPLVAATSTR